MKKIIIAALFLLVPVFSCFADFELKVLGDLNIDLDSNYESAPGITAGFEFSPITIRGRDSIFLDVMGSYSSLVVPNVGNYTFMDAQLGLGYNFRAIDRLGVSLEGFGGLWNIPVSLVDEAKGAAGILIGGRASVNYYVLPELTLGFATGFKNYSTIDHNVFTNRIEIGLILKYNFSEGLFGSPDVVSQDVSEVQAGPLFPVFYSRYADHNFGSLTFINNEKNDIRDVEVSVFIEQFMTNPDVACKFDYVARGDTFTADLTAFLNENILNTLIPQKADAKVSVKYRSLGKWMVSEQTVELSALGRNSMTWEDDRAAAAFISGRDASAAAFAKQVKSVVMDELNPNSPVNPQYGAALFGALKAYGINYVVDPSSAFTDNIGTSSVDFLKFPYQTLLYRGGDCDDLTILNCSLYDAIGIDSALITVPGHIFMAFDSGLTEDQTVQIKDGIFIVQDGKVWIPVEITLCQDTYQLAKVTAFREWNKWTEERLLIPVKDAWKEYKAVGIPESDMKIEMPSKKEIIDGFKSNR